MLRALLFTRRSPGRELRIGEKSYWSEAGTAVVLTRRHFWEQFGAGEVDPPGGQVLQGGEVLGGLHSHLW